MSMASRAEKGQEFAPAFGPTEHPPAPLRQHQAKGPPNSSGMRVEVLPADGRSSSGWGTSWETIAFAQHAQRSSALTGARWGPSNRGDIIRGGRSARPLPRQGRVLMRAAQRHSPAPNAPPHGLSSHGHDRLLLHAQRGQHGGGNVRCRQPRHGQLLLLHIGGAGGWRGAEGGASRIRGCGMRVKPPWTPRPPPCSWAAPSWAARRSTAWRALSCAGLEHSRAPASQWRQGRGYAQGPGVERGLLTA